LIWRFITYRIVQIIAHQKTKKEVLIKSKLKVNGIVVKTEAFDNILSLSGSIEANEQVEIRSEVSGIVESINFKEGSAVAAGQLFLIMILN
jgi:membrane fusion protein (multidrug efflux system)